MRSLTWTKHIFMPVCRRAPQDIKMRRTELSLCVSLLSVHPGVWRARVCTCTCDCTCVLCYLCVCIYLDVDTCSVCVHVCVCKCTVCVNARVCCVFVLTASHVLTPIQTKHTSWACRLSPASHREPVERGRWGPQLTKKEDLDRLHRDSIHYPVTAPARASPFSTPVWLLSASRVTRGEVICR